MPRAICLECKEDRHIRARGLCHRCRETPSVWAKYPEPQVQRQKRLNEHCLHCRRTDVPASAGRGLCQRCYKQPAIREQYTRFVDCQNKVDNDEPWLSEFEWYSETRCDHDKLDGECAVCERGQREGRVYAEDVEEAVPDRRSLRSVLELLDSLGGSLGKPRAGVASDMSSSLLTVSNGSAWRRVS